MSALSHETYYVITPPPLRNLADRCKMACRWLHMAQYGNRK